MTDEEFANEFVEFCRTWKRMCDKRYSDGIVECDQCELRMARTGDNNRTLCGVLADLFAQRFRFTDTDISRAIAIVQQWGKENPPKTYLDDYFEKFPYARKNEHGTPRVCVSDIYGNKKIDCIMYDTDGGGYDCDSCWRCPMPEENAS